MEGEWQTIEYDIHMHVQVLICTWKRKIMTMKEPIVTRDHFTMDSETDPDRAHDHGHRTELEMGCRMWYMRENEWACRQ